MRWIMAIILAIVPGMVFAQEVQKPARVDATVDRGLGFLVKDALAWRNEHKCVSCHHAGLVIWSMHEARRFGRSSNSGPLNNS